MSDKKINEGRLEKFIDKVFDSLKKKRAAQLKKELQDPVLKKKIDDFNKEYEDLIKYMNDKYGE